LAAARPPCRQLSYLNQYFGRSGVSSSCQIASLKYQGWTVLATLLGIIASMGIDLRWEDERGSVLAELGDPGFLVARFLPPFDARDFHCLKFVDPAGDTVFNQVQIPELVRELEGLATRRFEPRVETHLRAVLEFVRQAVGKSHTYIKFQGD
jgi:hypothetical protein